MKPSRFAQAIIIAILLFVLLCITSCVTHREKKRAAICATCPEIVRIDSVSTVKIITRLRDTTITTPADSSFYEAYIKCLNGKPVIINSKQKDGKRSSVKVEIDSDGILSVNCKADSLEQVIHIKDTEIERLTKLSKESITPNKKEKRWLEDVFYPVGFVTCCLISLIAVIVLVLMALGKKVFGEYDRM
jgi:hypothetical protein